MVEFDPAYKKLAAAEENLSDESDSKKASTAIFGLLSLYLSYDHYLAIQSSSSEYLFRKGYDTEWNPPKSAIEIQTVTYSSALSYSVTNQSFFLEVDPVASKYVGQPSPEIDKNWMELLGDDYLVLSEEAALQLDDPVRIKGHYLGQVEVLHSLHCLNLIRKKLDQEYYRLHDPHTWPESDRDAQIDHCLDQLRQTIQCACDLTPVPLRPYEDGSKIVAVIGTPEAHTCRSWDSFRNWWVERDRTNGGSLSWNR